MRLTVSRPEVKFVQYKRGPIALHPRTRAAADLFVAFGEPGNFIKLGPIWMRRRGPHVEGDLAHRVSPLQKCAVEQFNGSRDDRL